MKTNVQLTIEGNINKQIMKLVKMPYKTEYTKSKLKALVVIRQIIIGSNPTIELLDSIEAKFLFFDRAYDITEELTAQIEANELKDYEIKEAEEIINKLNIGVK